MTQRPTRLRRWATALATDLGFVGRSMRARPVGSLLIFVALAVVIGLCAGFFCLCFNATLRAHDAHEPGRLVGMSRVPVTMLGDLSRLRSFVSVGADGGARVVIEADPPVQVNTAVVTAGWFPTVRPRLLLGRGFEAHEHLGELPEAVVISEALWERLYGRAPGVIGRSLKLQGDIDARIVGVMSGGFAAPRHRSEGSDIWLPIREDQLRKSETALDPVARLREGVSVDEAEREVDQLIKSYRELPAGLRKDQQVGVYSFNTFGLSTQQVALFAMWVASLFLLLVGCANAGTYLLGRAIDRRREHAIARALGAWPGRLVRQCFLLGGLLSVAGAIVGTTAVFALMEPFKLRYISAWNLNPGFRRAGFDVPTLISWCW